jgi:hypothetical protein
MRSLTVTAAVDFCAIEVSAFRSIRYLLIGPRADSFYHNFDSWVTLDQTVFVLDSISDERIVDLAYFLSRLRWTTTTKECALAKFLNALTSMFGSLVSAVRLSVNCRLHVLDCTGITFILLNSRAARHDRAKIFRGAF